MLKTIKAKIIHGKVEPCAPLPFSEGAEVEVTAPVFQKRAVKDPTQATAGAWGNLLDCEEFEDDIYRSRLTDNRPAVSL